MRLKGVHMWRCFILTDAVNDLLEYKNCDRYPALYFVLFLKWLCFKFYWIEAAPRWKWIYIYHVLLWGRSSRVHAELCAQLNSLDEATSGYICSHHIHWSPWFRLWMFLFVACHCKALNSVSKWLYWAQMLRVFLHYDVQEHASLLLFKKVALFAIDGFIVAPSTESIGTIHLGTVYWQACVCV